jgi:DNA invertase Pin-like site-specific DNA recombinase
MSEGQAMKKAKQAATGKATGYARVSTDKQDADRQRLDIQAFAEAQGLALARMVVETVSSRKQEREVYAVVEGLRAGDTLIVTELSRLARSMIELNGIIAQILLKGASLRVVSGQVVDESIGSQSLVFALGIAAQVERDLISERTTSALRARKAAGVKLGRPKGQGKKVEAAAEAQGLALDMIDRMQGAGTSAAAIGKMLRLDARTVLRWQAERAKAAME